MTSEKTLFSNKLTLSGTEGQYFNILLGGYDSTRNIDSGVGLENHLGDMEIATFEN